MRLMPKIKSLCKNVSDSNGIVFFQSIKRCLFLCYIWEKTIPNPDKEDSATATRIINLCNSICEAPVMKFVTS